MGIRFSKSIKLGDLLKINISKSGISATVGKKGASINLGSKGTYLNLSPTVAGITGTGVSYRKKLTGGYGSLLDKLTTKDKKDKKEENIETDISQTSVKQPKEIDNIDEDKILQEYEDNLNASINVHTLAEKVLNTKQFQEKIASETNDSIKSIYELSRDGDEDTIESLVGSFMMNLDFVYPVKANYELEEDVLYVDLDLPEIEQLEQEYPSIVKDKIINKKKTNNQLKQEYAYTVMSLSAYLAAELFNLSSFVKQIVLSGFTSTRDSKGDLVDQYLYSIKYNRDIFEITDLSKVDDIYDFILKFENRINFNISNYSFKAISPYEMPSVEKANSLIDEAIAGLKQLGYKNDVINGIIPKLNELQLETSGEYLKQALKLISENK